MSLIILSILLLVIIYALLTPYKMKEFLTENCPPTPHPACDASTINNIKNQINVLQLKITNLQKEMDENKAKTQKNTQEITKFNNLIKQLETELKDTGDKLKN